MDPSNYPTNRPHNLVNRQGYIMEGQERRTDRSEYTSSRQEYSADGRPQQGPECMLERQEYIMNRPEHTQNRLEYTGGQECSIHQRETRSDLTLPRPDYSNRQEHAVDKQGNRLKHTMTGPEYTSRPDHAIDRSELNRSEYPTCRPAESVDRPECLTNKPEPAHTVNRPEYSKDRQEYLMNRQTVLSNRSDCISSLNRVEYSVSRPVCSQDIPEYRMRPDDGVYRLEHTSSTYRSDFEQDKCESAPNRMQQTDKRPECEISCQSELADRPVTDHQRSEYTMNRQRHVADSESQTTNRQEHSVNQTEVSAERTEENMNRYEAAQENSNPAPAESASILNKPEDGLNRQESILSRQEDVRNRQKSVLSGPEDVLERQEDVGGRPKSVLNRPEQEVDSQESSAELDSNQKEKLINCVFQTVYDLVKSISCEVFLKVVDSDSNALVYGTNDFLNRYFDKGLHAHHKDVLIGVETDKFASKLKEKLVPQNKDAQETVFPGKRGEKHEPQVKYADNAVQTGNALNNNPPVTLRRTRRRKQPSPKRAVETMPRPVKRKRGRPPRGKNKKTAAEKKVSHKSLQPPTDEQVSEDGSDNDEDTYDVPDDDKDEDYKPTTQPRAKRKYTFVRRKPRKAADPGELKLSTCEICGETFKKVQEFKEHKKKHAKERLTCKECGKTLGGYSNLQQHIRAVHKKERPFQCKICEKTFTSATHLTMHRETHATEDEKKLQCDKCGKKFTHTTTLKAHVRTYHREKIYECETCGRKFPQKSNLIVHIRCHTGEKPYQCDQCGRTFSQPSSLRSHKFIHTGEKPFKCSVCEYAFVRADDLKAHFRRHTGERPFQCEICGKRFSKNQQMVDHKRHHTGDKRYKCQLCGGMFYKSGHLKRHMTIHSGEKPFQCQVCGKKVNRADNLRTHMKVHRKEVDGANIPKQAKKLKTSPATNVIESTTNPNDDVMHMQMTISPQQQSRTNIPVPVNHSTQLRSEADRMYVEPLAIQSAIDALGALQHDHW